LNIYKHLAWRRVQRDISQMPHEVAAQVMRRCAAEGVGDLRLLRALSERALETAPEETRYLYKKWARVYAEGRRVKVTVTTVEPEADEDLIDAVNEAFIGWDGEL
jgi:hypothetical protein